MSPGAACHILVVDDDRELRALVGKYLAEHGFRVTHAANGREMMNAIEVGRFDLVVLDLMMPGENGLVLCQKLRERNGPPVIMLTAMGSEVDRVIGLEIGADDYVVKPFSPRELVARIKAVLRRAAKVAPDPDDLPFAYEFDGWRLEPAQTSLALPERRGRRRHERRVRPASGLCGARPARADPRPTARSRTRAVERRA